MGERRQKSRSMIGIGINVRLPFLFRSTKLSGGKTLLTWLSFFFRFLFKRRVKEMMGRGKELCAPAHPDHLLELSCTEFGQSKETDRQTERQTQSRWDYS